MTRVMNLASSIVYLPDVPISKSLVVARRQLDIDLGSDAATKAYQDNDWRRVSYIQSHIPSGTSVLDVGTGQGHFSNAMATRGDAIRLATIDIKTSPRFRKHGDYEQYRMSVAAMDFAEDEFDHVVCMEVIEHLENVDFQPALDELRRVAGKKLLLTIRLCEPEPIAPYHRQRFDPARILTLFPDAKLTLLLKRPVNRIPWLLIEEEIRNVYKT